MGPEGSSLIILDEQYPGVTIDSKPLSKVKKFFKKRTSIVAQIYSVSFYSANFGNKKTNYARKRSSE